MLVQSAKDSPIFLNLGTNKVMAAKKRKTTEFVSSGAVTKHTTPSKEKEAERLEIEAAKQKNKA